MKKSNLKILCILVAGGEGKRLNSDVPKQFLQIGDDSILGKSILAFKNCKTISQIQIVYNSNYEEYYRKYIDEYNLLAPVAGGETRQESVFNGLKAIEKYNPDYVLIHDAARPFVEKQLIEQIIYNLEKNDAVIPAIKVADSLKYCENGLIKKSIKRNNLYQAQTPQGFAYKKIYSCHKKLAGESFTDDSAIFEYFNEKIKVVEGTINNFKITTDQDLQRARDLMEYKQPLPLIKTGTGFDVHAFCKPKLEKNNFIKLCGVEIPFSSSLKGHSDADVAIHAIVDAILGALGEGDIGEHFPPTDDKFKNMDSAIFLEFCNELLITSNAQINNIDVTIICEAPKISPYKEVMKKQIAKILKITDDRVNVKATTTEKLGFTGRKEGIASQAVATISIYG